MGGTWIQLSENPSAMDKYSTAIIAAYLVLDPGVAKNCRPLDDKEYIEILPGITIPKIME
jgi:hypothetical protein